MTSLIELVVDALFQANQPCFINLNEPKKINDDDTMAYCLHYVIYIIKNLQGVKTYEAGLTSFVKF